MLTALSHCTGARGERQSKKQWLSEWTGAWGKDAPVLCMLHEPNSHPNDALPEHDVVTNPGYSKGDKREFSSQNGEVCWANVTYVSCDHVYVQCPRPGHLFTSHSLPKRKAMATHMLQFVVNKTPFEISQASSKLKTDEKVNHIPVSPHVLLLLGKLFTV